MPVKQTIEQGVVPVKVFTDDLEASARQQLVNLSKLPDRSPPRGGNA